MTAPSAFADGCLSVDATGVCGTDATFGGNTVGGTVPAQTVLEQTTISSPTTVCVLVTCIPQGQPLATVPAIGTPEVDLPSETLPSVTLPVGNPRVVINQCLRPASPLLFAEGFVSDFDSNGVSALNDPGDYANNYLDEVTNCPPS
jgi:hypothetical protein